MSDPIVSQPNAPTDAEVVDAEVVDAEVVDTGGAARQPDDVHFLDFDDERGSEIDDFTSEMHRAEELVEHDVDALLAERDSFKDIALRLQADFENYRKRVAAQQRGEHGGHPWVDRPLFHALTVPVWVHRAELHLGRIDLVELESAAIDGEAKTLEVLEERLDGVDFSGGIKVFHDAETVRLKLCDLRGGYQRACCGVCGGGHDGQAKHSVINRFRC